ncbi:hypothetical protein ACLBR5_31445 [Escherichia coli]
MAFISTDKISPSKSFTIGVDELKKEIGYIQNQKFSFFKRDGINIAIDEITERTILKTLNVLMLKGRVEESAKSVQIEMR